MCIETIHICKITTDNLNDNLFLCCCQGFCQSEAHRYVRAKHTVCQSEDFNIRSLILFFHYIHLLNFKMRLQYNGNLNGRNKGINHHSDA